MTDDTAGRYLDRATAHSIRTARFSMVPEGFHQTDDCVAEAEQYAHDLAVTGREQYREILQRAHDAARQAAGGLEPDALAASTVEAVDGTELEYVRTYVRVAQVQLRSVIDALAAEVDKLGQVPEPRQGYGDHDVAASALQR